MATSRNSPDATSIIPVSSLRSKFENLGKDADTPQAGAVAPRQTSLSVNAPVTDDRPRTSGGDDSVESVAATSANGSPAPVLRKRRPSPPKLRPQSMITVTPSQMSPPTVTVESPHSPAKTASIGVRSSASNSPLRPLTPASGSASPTRSHHANALSRTITPTLEPRMTTSDQPSEAPNNNRLRRPELSVANSGSLARGMPPPINRIGKPSVPKKPANLVPKAITLAVAEPTTEHTDQSTSPFSTPPSSGENSPNIKKNGVPTRMRNDSDASFVERLHSDSDASSTPRSRGISDASFVQRLRGDSNASYMERARAGSNASFVEPSTLPESWLPSPTYHNVAAGHEHQGNGIMRTGTMPARYKEAQERERAIAGDFSNDRPRLPARPELLSRSGRTSPPKPRSGRASPIKAQMSAARSVDGLRRAATTIEHPSTHRIPASKPAQRSALGLGFDRDPPSPNAAPAVPAPRRSMDRRREIPSPQPPVNARSRDSESHSSPVEHSGGNTIGPSDFPDSSSANRRPPKYKQRPYQIPTEYDTRLLAICGEYVVTAGYITKAWNLRTGEQLLNLAHHENVKVTSLVFKPSSDLDDEGKRIWLGTNIGEIHEVDISSQHLVKTKSAHTRHEVIRMFRHAFELWTLDDGGELNVWKPDQKGVLSLDSQCSNFRVPRGHSFSIACGERLWIATGKEIRIFMPDARSDAEFQVLRSPLSQAGTGDITSGTTLSPKPELVYFGHADGKVSIYNQHTYSCVAVVYVSLYKISSMVGVGEYLWAGYSTGMTYVYDTSTTPWQVKKDWQAHEKQVCGIVADPSALWRMDKLQVVTLGTDNMLRIWDGLLEEEWLEQRMQEHDSEYCTFREMTAAILTWNAGASKPQYLQHSMEDSNFFQEYMASREPPDLFVFGFQELVDLEDKKMTAKSLFKSKKKDGSEQEHMSHQYRAWRDHLTKCIEEYMPTNHPYTLLHTATLVGLFTCVFVKSSERKRIKHVHTAEVKRGMGGIYGNKGALVLRMVMDDSSICFINCHLAAGQTQTIHRNNDIAAILEAEALPAYPLNKSSGAQHSDVFASGGDGSMILDHEICVLNGDLNYRIDTMGRDTVVKQIQQHNFVRLLERDQLLLSRKKNPGFRLRAFQESPITFAPTYKYNLRSNDYDTSEKQRAPAWCDRILYRGLGKVRMEEYRRWEVKISDHRPVSGRLRMRVKTVEAERREQVWAKCQQEFEEHRRKTGRAVQLEYLSSVLGMSPREAASALPRYQ